MGDPLVARSLTRLLPVRRARSPRPQPRALRPRRRILCSFFLAAIGSLSGPPCVADEAVTKQEMQGLDEQVQEIKSDVLRIAAELNRLEEKLLYPSDTQVAVFVSLEENETFRLDSVQIRIDGELVTHHIYTFKELEALRKGGVQRIYTGNVPTGAHELAVSIAGKLQSGKDLSGSATFPFSKDVEPELIGLELAGQDSGAASIRLGAW